MSETPLAAWMGDVSPEQLGFPLEVDRNLYSKETGIVYKNTASGALELDLYRPLGTDRPAAPGVIMIHGGGWHGGGRFQMGLTRWAGYLASAGFCVVSIDYRLAPQTAYPDSFQDCLDAIDYFVDHAAEFGVDPDRLGLWGDSAGGHLVLLTATSQTQPHPSGPRLRCGGSRFRGVVAWYPPTDLLALHQLAQRAQAGDSVVSAFAGTDPSQDMARWEEISPIRQVHAATPPCLILQGTADFLVPHDQATRYAERAKEVGADVELHLVEGAPHGLDRVAAGPEARRLIERSRAFLLEQL